MQTKREILLANIHVLSIWSCVDLQICGCGTGHNIQERVVSLIVAMPFFVSAVKCMLGIVYWLCMWPSLFPRVFHVERFLLVLPVLEPVKFMRVDEEGVNHVGLYKASEPADWGSGLSVCTIWYFCSTESALLRGRTWLSKEWSRTYLHLCTLRVISLLVHVFYVVWLLVQWKPFFLQRRMCGLELSCRSYWRVN